MGLQHYKIYLIPREFRGDPEEDNHWAVRQPDSELLERYCKLLPRDTSWGDVSEFRTAASFGSVVYVWRDSELVQSLQLEWTPSDLEILNKICGLAREMECSIWSGETGLYLEPRIEQLVEDWKNTKSARFVESPVETLVSSARNLEENTERTMRSIQY